MILQATTTITHYKDLISLCFSLCAIIIAFLGLQTWRKKLWGESKFSLAIETLRELRILIDEIGYYRAPFYSAGEIAAAYKETEKKELDQIIGTEMDHAHIYAERIRWNKVIIQYNNFLDKMLRLKVLVNSYDLDVLDGKTMRNYLMDMELAHVHLDMNKVNRSELKDMEADERTEYSKKMKQVHTILSHEGDEDHFQAMIDNYFACINKRLRKYLK